MSQWRCRPSTAPNLEGHDHPAPVGETGKKARRGDLRSVLGAFHAPSWRSDHRAFGSTAFKAARLHGLVMTNLHFPIFLWAITGPLGASQIRPAASAHFT
jgi:hypothetical protein